jgi:uncharacterized membrane protein
MHLTKDMEHVNLCGILWYIHLYSHHSFSTHINIVQLSMTTLGADHLIFEGGGGGGGGGGGWKSQSVQ